MNALSRLFDYARQHRRDAWLASLYSVLNKFFDILPEVLIGVAVDVVVNKQTSFLARFGITDTMQQLVLLGILTVLIWGGESLFQFLYEVKWRNLAQSLQHQLRLDAYRHVQKLPLTYFESKSTGKLMAILNDDINQMERFLNGGANSIIQVFCSSLMVGAVFFLLAPKLALISLLPVPLILYGTFWFQRRLAPRYAEVREAAGVINGRLNNNLLGIATIKAFTAEEFEAAHIRDASEHYRSTNARAIQLSAAITPVIRMAILAGFVATLVYGGWMATHGEIGVGSYSVLVYLTQRLLWPLTGLADIADLYQRSMASIERVLGVLATPQTIPYEGRALPVATVAGRLEFDALSFAYANIATLKNVTLTVEPGQTVALVGATGSGKSTLVKLLLRFYQPQAGQIRLDGHDIQQLDLTDLRRAIGYVSQDVFLTDGSVADNIAYGLSNISRATIVAAAKAAEAHDYIKHLPQGYDTQIGERGQKLSGGQRQRLALARAILKNPPLLVLDEATSAVDNETEAAIQRSLEVISRNRTTLVIAHRLSTVRQADCIHVLEQGEIVESGTHESLLAQNGSYAALWRLQTGERPVHDVPPSLV
ncbi:MAG TPA: ABC transporter ATP-binding protein [Pseudogulbenkiania sp.]|nr:ABC transporter ATP-binding protein [Pseudogulbenkiania sp.]